jgi:hypothetical protein
MKQMTRGIALAAGLLTMMSVPSIQAQQATTSSEAAGTHQQLVSPEQQLADRIEQRLTAEAALRRYDVHVAMEGGVATLTGTVPSPSLRMRAQTLATVPGVVAVNNQLTVDPKAKVAATSGSRDKKAKPATTTDEQKTSKPVDR